jgi:hypothetical protein
MEGLRSGPILRTARGLTAAGTAVSLAALEGVLNDSERRQLRELAVLDAPGGTQSPGDCARELRHQALKKRLAEIQRCLEGATGDTLEALLQEKLSVKRLIGNL